MKKGFVLIAVLTAWMAVKNNQTMHVFTNNTASINKTAVQVAQQVQQKLLSFTSVYLSGSNIKTNSCKHTQKTGPLQASRKTHPLNHETLLTIHSL